MKKAIALVILLFTAASVFGQEFNLNDMYGLWKCDDEDFDFYYFIDSTTLILINDHEKKCWVYNILSWQPYINQNIETKNDYPFGYFLTLQEAGTTRVDFINIVLIHRNKSKMFFERSPEDIYLKI